MQRVPLCPPWNFPSPVRGAWRVISPVACWPAVLREHYGESFLLARTAARLLTYPQFLPLAGPLALRGPVGRMLMPAAARLMGNLITDDDRDLIARTWRAAGRTVSSLRRDTPLWDSTAA